MDGVRNEEHPGLKRPQLTADGIFLYRLLGENFPMYTWTHLSRSCVHVKHINKHVRH